MGATERAVTISGRQSARQSRRKTGHKRLLVGALVVLAIALIAAVTLRPYVRKAIQHFQLPLSYSTIIRQQAADKHLDPALIAAVIYAETRFVPRTSSAGAEGLMQIEPATAEFLAHRSGATTFTVADLGTPAVNIAYGSYYLRYLLNEYDGNRILALAAYNAGETNVNHWIRKYQERGERFMIKDIPIAQTSAYVREVLAKQVAYRARYPRQLGYG